MGTLAHCGLTSPVRQSLKLPGHDIGLVSRGDWVFARPGASLVSQPQEQLQDPWQYREPLSSSVDLSSPHRERIRCRWVTSWRNCLINARPWSDVAMLPVSCNN